MNKAEDGGSNIELYALLHVSPEASDEEILEAYRQWAQIYHPDKYQALQALFLPQFLFYFIRLLKCDFMMDFLCLIIVFPILFRLVFI